jgi:hypothetical protein
MTHPLRTSQFDSATSDRQGAFTEIELKVAGESAALCATTSAGLIEFAGKANSVEKSAEVLHSMISMLHTAVSIALEFQFYVESELLLASAEPTPVGGLPFVRPTAHSTATAIAERVLRGIWAAVTESNGSGPLESFDPSFVTGSPRAVIDYLRTVDRFDHELLAEMIKQESARALDAYHERLAAERRDRQLRQIDDPIVRSKREAAAYCRVSVRTIERWAENGRLPSVPHDDGGFVFSKSTLQILRTTRLERERRGRYCDRNTTPGG